MRKYTFYLPAGDTVTYEADGDSLQPTGCVILFNKTPVSSKVATEAEKTDIVTVFSPHHYRNYVFQEIEQNIVPAKIQVLKPGHA